VVAELTVGAAAAVVEVMVENPPVEPVVGEPAPEVGKVIQFVGMPVEAVIVSRVLGLKPVAVIHRFADVAIVPVGA